jgi:hypothetical protein
VRSARLRHEFFDPLRTTDSPHIQQRGIAELAFIEMTTNQIYERLLWIQMRGHTQSEGPCCLIQGFLHSQTKVMIGRQFSIPKPLIQVLYQMSPRLMRFAADRVAIRCLEAVLQETSEKA